MDIILITTSVVQANQSSFNPKPMIYSTGFFVQIF